MSLSSLPIDEEGFFAGYASVFGVLDQGGDIVQPGAFKKSLGERGRGGIRMLFQHDPKEPVGLWERLYEDSRGLWAEGRLLPGVPRADALKRLIAAGALDGLSIGFRTVRAARQAGTGHRRLIEIDLWEISIVTFPMMDGARIAALRGVDPDAVLSRSLDAAITLLTNP